MDLSFLPPLIAGAVLTSGTGLLTGMRADKRDKARQEREREDALAAQKSAVGRDAGALLLDDLVRLFGTVMRGDVYTDGLRTRYAFDVHAVDSGRTHALLITDRRLRSAAWSAMNALTAVGPAEQELQDVPQRQQSVVHNLMVATSAYLRLEDLPEVALAYVESFNKTVDDAWRGVARSEGLDVD